MVETTVVVTVRTIEYAILLLMQPSNVASRKSTFGHIEDVRIHPRSSHARQTDIKWLLSWRTEWVTPTSSMNDGVRRMVIIKS